MNAEEVLCADMGRFFADPLGFVIYAYPWDTDPSIQLVRLPAPYNLLYNCEFGPDKWACDFLADLGEKVRARRFDGVHAVEPIRESVASGHGIGKGALTAWLVGWIMSTRPYAKGTVTANTAPQLETKTWAQIVSWTKRCVTSHWFEITTGRGSMRMSHKQHPSDWYCSAQTCREENSEAFAGQHAANSSSFYIFDEASAVPDKIHEVSEGGLTDGQPMLFAFGNPTRPTGWFADAFGRMRHRWGTRQIDSRTVQITNKAEIDRMIADYGIDSDRVKVRVRGMFPSLSARQFISTEDADAGLGRVLRPEQYNFAEKILTCDPAWEGDDELVIGLRQGLAYSTLRTIAKNDNDLEIARILAQLEDEHEADAVFVDGGFGTGIISAGRSMGRDWIIVWFGAKSSDPGCLNKRMEMWKASRDWLKAGGAYPNDPVMQRQATGPELVPRLDGKLQLESKADMKARGLESPGRWDALALSFAYPVQKKLRFPFNRQPARDYNPLEAADNSLNPKARDYDPFAHMNR